MSIAYQVLCRLECLHGYFADRRCRVLSLVPTAACEALLRRYRLLFRQTVAGAEILFPVREDSPLASLYDAAAPLTFLVVASDPLLRSYTEGPSDATGAPVGLHHFSNREEHVADVFGQPRLLLHPAEQPLAQPPLPLRAGRFTHRFAQPVTAADLRITDHLRGQPVWQTRTPPQAISSFAIDLRGQDAGGYQLSVDGTAALDFYLGDGVVPMAWGVIDLFPGGPRQAPHLPPGCQVIDAQGKFRPDAQGEPKTFTVALASRKTIWRYYIFGQTDAGAPQIASYEITGKGKSPAQGGHAETEAIAFRAWDQPVTLDGRTASVFESGQPVPLCELPSQESYQFTLREVGRGRAAGREIPLPFATPAALKRDLAGGTSLCSEMFVYLGRNPN